MYRHKAEFDKKFDLFLKSVERNLTELSDIIDSGKLKAFTQNEQKLMRIQHEMSTTLMGSLMGLSVLRDKRSTIYVNDNEWKHFLRRAADDQKMATRLFLLEVKNNIVVHKKLREGKVYFDLEKYSLIDVDINWRYNQEEIPLVREAKHRFENDFSLKDKIKILIELDCLPERTIPGHVSNSLITNMVDKIIQDGKLSSLMRKIETLHVENNNMLKTNNQDLVNKLLEFNKETTTKILVDLQAIPKEIPIAIDNKTVTRFVQDIINRGKKKDLIDVINETLQR